MSEEILKALMQLFAIIAKQDEGVEHSEREFVKTFLTQQLNDEAVQEYLALFDNFADINKAPAENGEESKKKLTSVKDSVRILGICKKINKTLTQEQKVVALVRLFELVNTDRKFSEQRMAIINTVAEVFKFSKEEFKSIETFVINNHPEELDQPDILVISDKTLPNQQSKFIPTEKLDGDIFILRVSSVELYFLKYTGAEDLFLNGLVISNRRIYLFASGSAVKMPKGKPVYYSDVVSHFLADITSSKISFEVNDLEFRFANGNLGLQNISFAEGHGKLIGIMGASGAGKTTLLNVLCGTEAPSKGEVIINGYNLHTEKEKLEGVIGLIPQDDLLIEELTVYENLFYSAKLCFKDKTDEEINGLVIKTLSSLGLLERKDLKVGSPLNKTISGGQRKRLNIALELIREPSILFVDEPTSGLSSRDSENVMDLLRELALKGKLIFVVIHQPSSEIYKMFDRMIILDTGGYMIYYGNPVEAVMYFKRIDAQINSDVGECPVCGNVNPELIFNIIEAKVVDEFGRYTDKRKVQPTKWEEYYQENHVADKLQTINEAPPKTLNIPNWFNQTKIYTLRDFFSKISNTQYIALNLLEAPILGFILSYIIRYIADPASDVYIFRENENIPIYIFMSLIVALFLGLTVSAEEIFRDRKILKREKFLNLSKSGYLISKIFILFTISAIQSITFVLIANSILGIHDMYFSYWLALFTTAAFANMLGLNISASFNSAVTIYILIPLVMIPMMILSGAMFSFDKLNRNVGSVDKVPLLAEFMVTKWSYEALMVHQFKDNKFERHFYDVEKRKSNADFKQAFVIPELQKRLDACKADFAQNGKITKTSAQLELLKNEIAKELKVNHKLPFKNADGISAEKYGAKMETALQSFIDKMLAYHSAEFTAAEQELQGKINNELKKNEKRYNFYKDTYQNDNLSDMVKKVLEKNKILEFNHELVQQYHPIYMDPTTKSVLSWRSHFFAPRKPFLGKLYDTYWYNVIVVWLFTLTLYITLYYDALKKLLDLFGKISFKKQTKE
ncbi:MAG: ATP-binding cassette domain-containing protein [Bacteroidota bacterium]|nr:ATP-binding cassette domain-containing protein [Bacteroidota bacterium]